MGAWPVAATAEDGWLRLLAGLGSSQMDPVAYDTAWAVRVRGSGGRGLAHPEAWDWLCAHQRADGSWGADTPFLPDRLAATTAALVALAEAARDGLRPPRPGALHTGQRFLRAALPRLPSGPSVDTVGFELCLPPLLTEARRLGLDVPPAPQALERRRADKLSRLPAGWRSQPPASLAHSLEGWVGELPPAGVLRSSGGCACSPSATACHQRLAPTPAAAAYLRRARSAGGMRDVFPFDVFELAWTLDHLALAGADLRGPEFHGPALRLRSAWNAETGVGAAAEGLEPDADDTALTVVALARAGVRVSPAPLLRFEREAGFACFPWERDPSVSANANVAYALRRARSEAAAAAVAKVRAFLADTRSPEGFWSDKWHLSPYYPTSRAILAVHAVAPDLAAPALAWLRDSQRADGSWGAWGGSPEETAYAVQALAVRGATEAVALRRALAYLRECPERPALWIGKGLYCPRRVVDAAVASALTLAAALTAPGAKPPPAHGRVAWAAAGGARR